MLCRKAAQERQVRTNWILTLLVWRVRSKVLTTSCWCAIWFTSLGRLRASPQSIPKLPSANPTSVQPPEIFPWPCRGLPPTEVWIWEILRCPRAMCRGHQGFTHTIFKQKSIVVSSSWNGISHTIPRGYLTSPRLVRFESPWGQHLNTCTPFLGPRKRFIRYYIVIFWQLRHIDPDGFRGR